MKSVSAQGCVIGDRTTNREVISLIFLSHSPFSIFLANAPDQITTQKGRKKAPTTINMNYSSSFRAGAPDATSTTTIVRLLYTSNWFCSLLLRTFYFASLHAAPAFMLFSAFKPCARENLSKYKKNIKAKHWRRLSM